MDYFQYLSSDLVRVVSLTLAFSLFLYYILSWKSKGSSLAKKIPPQAGRAWPIIGHLHLLARKSQPPHLVLGKMADKYGPIFTVKMGVHRALVVSSSESVKDCLKTNDKVFAGRPKTLAGEIMGYNFAFFAFSPYGDYFFQVRKIVILKVFSNQRIEMLKHIRESEVKASIKQVYERCCRQQSNNQKALVEMEQWFIAINENIIFRMIVGKRLSEATSNWRETLKEYLRLLATIVVSDAIPSLRWLDLGGHEKAMKKITKEVDHVLEGCLQEHKQKRMKIINSGQAMKGDDDDDEEEEDFMDAMLSILDADDADTKNYDVDTIIKVTSLVLLLGGIDTTAGTLTWALSLLLNHPEALKKVQKELDQKIGRERQVKESDTDNLVYLQAVIKETLRLYPPGPLAMAHESTEDCTIGGYHVPAKTRLLVHISKLHRDAEVWADPNEFQPERFLTTHKSLDVKGQDFELIPFSSGRTICPGMSLSLKILPLTLAALIHGFEISTPNGEPVDMGEEMGLTNHKATPFQVFLTPRLPAQLYEE